jgi:hypothetical protein
LVRAVCYKPPNLLQKEGMGFCMHRVLHASPSLDSRVLLNLYMHLLFRTTYSSLPQVRRYRRVWAARKQGGGEDQVLLQRACNMQWLLSSRQRAQRVRALGKPAPELVLSSSEFHATFVAALLVSSNGSLQYNGEDLRALHALQHGKRTGISVA